MTPEILLFWSTLIASPPLTEYLVTGNRVIQCWYVDDTWYSYNTPSRGTHPGDDEFLPES